MICRRPALFVLFVAAAGAIECEYHDPFDLVFAIDGSGSISSESFQDQLDFIIEVGRGVDDSPTTGWIGVVQWSSTAEQSVPLQPRTSDSFEQLVSEIVQLGDLTYPDEGLRVVTEMLQGDTRDGKQVVVLMTDGSFPENHVTPAFLLSDHLKASGVTIVGIGVGESVNMQQIEYLASPGLTRDVQDYQALDDVVNYLVNVTCHAVTKSSPTPSPSPSPSPSPVKGDDDYGFYAGIGVGVFVAVAAGGAAAVVLVCCAKRKRRMGKPMYVPHWTGFEGHPNSLFSRGAAQSLSEAQT